MEYIFVNFWKKNGGVKTVELLDLTNQNICDEMERFNIEKVKLIDEQYNTIINYLNTSMSKSSSRISTETYLKLLGINDNLNKLSFIHISGTKGKVSIPSISSTISF